MDQPPVSRGVLLRGMSSVPGCSCILYWFVGEYGGSCRGCGYGPADHRLCWLDRHTGLVYPAVEEDDPAANDDDGEDRGEGEEEALEGERALR